MTLDHATALAYQCDECSIKNFTENVAFGIIDFDSAQASRRSNSFALTYDLESEFSTSARRALVSAPEAPEIGKGLVQKPLDFCAFAQPLRAFVHMVFAIATAVSLIRFEKPHSLSYHDRIRQNFPPITLVWSM